MEWTKFDADKIHQKTIDKIVVTGEEILREEIKNNNQQLKVRDIIKDYDKGNRNDLNQVVGVDTFRPSEFDNITDNDESLKKIIDWLINQNIDWSVGSKTVQNGIDKSFESIDNKTILGGRERVILDNLIKVCDKIIAVEIEASINLDNGYWTLRQAIKIKRADYGIMIVPWFPLGSGRADEGKALGRLDREFDGKTDLNDGPIYRISPVRKIDSLIQLDKENKNYT